MLLKLSLFFFKRRKNSGSRNAQTVAQPQSYDMDEIDEGSPLSQQFIIYTE